MQTSTSTSSEKTPAGGPDAAPGAPQAGSEDSQKWFARHAKFAAHEPTGAFDNPLTSFRFSPRPYHWREVLLTVGVLYGTFIGLPAAAGIWAALKIWHKL